MLGILEKTPLSLCLRYEFVHIFLRVRRRVIHCLRTDGKRQHRMRLRGFTQAIPLNPEVCTTMPFPAGVEYHGRLCTQLLKRLQLRVCRRQTSGDRSIHDQCVLGRHVVRNFKPSFDTDQSSCKAFSACVMRKTAYLQAAHMLSDCRQAYAKRWVGGHLTSILLTLCAATDSQNGRGRSALTSLRTETARTVSISYFKVRRTC